jgi:hypothetical protein
MNRHRGRSLSLACIVVAALPLAVQAQSGTARASAAGGAPRLERIRFIHGLDTSFWSSPLGIGVSGTGRVGIPGDFGNASTIKHLFQILDAQAKAPLSTGRQGAGPGELNGSDVPIPGHPLLHVFNFSRLVVLRVADDGKVVTEFRPDIGMRYHLASIVGDSVDGALLQWTTTGIHPLIERLPLKGGKGRVLFTTGNAFVRGAVELPGRPGQLGTVAYTSMPGRIAIGNGREYRIVIHDADSRVIQTVTRALPPERRTPSELAELRKSLEADLKEIAGQPNLVWSTKSRLDTLPREAISHFGRGGLSFDASGRLWVIGRKGDSTFADAFEGTRFLGRQMLPCMRPERRIAMQGEWLALVCELPKGGDLPYQLQLYRVRG